MWHQQRNLRSRTTAALVAAFVALTAAVTAGPAAAASQGDGLLSTLVMGDSYSAGNGAGDYFGATGCWRSAKNYAREYERIVESRLGQRGFVENAACSGAVTQDFWLGKDGRPPMLDSVNTGYDVIFLTIGGNDVYFKDIVQHCLFEARRKATTCERNLARAESLLNGGEVERNIERVLSGIGERAHPEARVVLLGYPHLEGDEGFSLYRKGRKGQDEWVQVGRRVRAIGRRADQIQARAIAAANANSPNRYAFVPVKETFQGHELYAGKQDGFTTSNTDRWFVEPKIDASYSFTSLWYHPNALGHRAQAELLFADVRIPKRDVHNPQTTTDIVLRPDPGDSAMGGMVLLPQPTVPCPTGSTAVTFADSVVTATGRKVTFERGVVGLVASTWWGSEHGGVDAPIDLSNYLEHTPDYGAIFPAGTYYFQATCVRDGQTTYAYEPVVLPYRGGVTPVVQVTSQSLIISDTAGCPLPTDWISIGAGTPNDYQSAAVSAQQGEAWRVEVPVPNAAAADILNVGVECFEDTTSGPALRFRYEYWSRRLN